MFFNKNNKEQIRRHAGKKNGDTPGKKKSPLTKVVREEAGMWDLLDKDFKYAI